MKPIALALIDSWGTQTTEAHVRPKSNRRVMRRCIAQPDNYPRSIKSRIISEVILTTLTGLLSSMVCADLGYAATTSSRSAATAQETHVEIAPKKIASIKEKFYVSALAFNADSSQLAVNFMVEGQDVDVWSWGKGGRRLVRALRKPSGAGDGHALEYNPDGSLLAVRYNTTKDGKVIRVWDAKTGDVIHDVVETATEHGDSGDFAFSTDGKWLFRTITRGVYKPGDQLVAHRTDTWDRVWGLRTDPFGPHRIALSPDGRLAALGGQAVYDYTPPVFFRILLVDLTTRQIVRTIDVDKWIYALAWSPDGRRVAVGLIVGGDSPGPYAVRVFDISSGEQVAALKASTAYVTGLAYSPDGKSLFAGSIDDSVKILDSRDLAVLHVIPGDNRSLAVSRDNQFLAVASSGDISIWQLNVGQ